jgi:phage shock protein C
VSRSDQERRDAERVARRANRLADRAELRAHRKADSARQAAERSARLAERAGKAPGSREFEESLEDYVEHMTERFTRKATEWFGLSHADDDDYGLGEDDDGLGGEPRRSNANRSGYRRQGRQSRRTHHARRRPMWYRFKSGRPFYRDAERGKLLGVCAGLADYLQVETWQVRLAAVLGLFFMGSFILPTYFILYFVMENKPYYRTATDRFDEAHEYGDGSRSAHEKSSKPSRGAHQGRAGRFASSTNVQVLQLAREKFSQLENRVRSIETHVTSSRFELQREFKKIAGDDL